MIENEANSCYNKFGDNMRKLGVYILLSLLTIIPFKVQARSEEKVISNYEVDVKILEDGKVDVKEHIILSGKTSFTLKNNYLNCNGLNKILYVGMDNDLYGSDIYLPKLDSNVKAYNKDNNPILFKNNKTKSGEEYFFDDVSEVYLEYSFRDVIVTHADASEFYYNFFRNKFNLIIEEALIRIELPKKASYIKATDYEYHNNINIINNKIIEFKYSNLLRGIKDINIRLLFDKNLVTSFKHTDNYITIFVENDINNGIINKVKYWACVIFTIIFCLNFLRLVILVILKYGGNKKYKATPKFDETLVKRYNYAGINYLINKDITPEAFISGILDLINSGKLNVIKEGQDDYALVRGNINVGLTVDEEYLINFLLDIIDKKDKSEVDLVRLKKIKEFCSDNSSVTSFLVNFNVWKTLQVKNAREYRFMVGNEYYFSLRNSLIFSYIVLALNIICKTYFIPGIVAFIPVTLLVNIMIKLTKRSVVAEEAYKDVVDFKEGIKVIGSKTSDPYRWDLILISAVSMGCGIETEQLIKEKIQDGTLKEHYDSNLINVYRMYQSFDLVQSLLPTIKQAYKKSFFIYISKKDNNL